MRFNKLDLNLLVALDALLTERSISRAGERLHLSQPATSNALARLRTYFDDELLVQQGRTMVLTPRAEGLLDPVREVLMRIDSTIAEKPRFDPATSTRSFTLLVSDFTTTVLMQPLIEQLFQEAPGVQLHLRAQNNRPVEQLEEYGADVLIIPEQYASPRHPSVTLFEETYLCITWEGNPHISEALSFDDYLAAGHVVADYSGARHIPAFDGWFLERFGVKRRIEISAPTMAALPSLVIGTHRVATVHKRIALRAVQLGLPVRIWEPPLEIPPMRQKLQWHRHRDKDPGLEWLRERAMAVAARI
ncbi:MULTISPECIES: LysR family transcriptional regulator [Acidovorax]|jgi:LysR family nod box-dependent transcriptional activator|uniref:LysR family transcriptional regulator n=1 Tax=Acidovorax TaxID=12916 RepID=UPI0006FA8E4D|nr:MULTISPECIES: LysR family transcriptional regulator [unclassified Acidovorax]KQW24029.1 nodulation protein NfeD [Acidovorax sp. Root402]MCT6721067.1 LysR family transcriptional regulator [Acidovorax sp. K2F]PIF16171.1 LysR family transcriptional regulator [Acidovorax sp. 59]PKW04805.1 LysR family transcriptional regulator [Acidovorax sp. 30]PTT38405.1 LysR family transcriptional regulator [Acidovorax sp. HMWF018]